MYLVLFPVRIIITFSKHFRKFSTPFEMSSSVPYDPYIPNQTTGDESNSRTAAIQAVCTILLQKSSHRLCHHNKLDLLTYSKLTTQSEL